MSKSARKISEGRPRYSLACAFAKAHVLSLHLPTGTVGCTRVGPAALVTADLLGERAAGLPPPPTEVASLAHALVRTLPQLRLGRSAAAL